MLSPLSRATNNLLILTLQGNDMRAHESQATAHSLVASGLGKGKRRTRSKFVRLCYFFLRPCSGNVSACIYAYRMPIGEKRQGWDMQGRKQKNKGKRCATIMQCRSCSREPNIGVKRQTIDLQKSLAFNVRWPFKAAAGKKERGCVCVVQLAMGSVK